MSGQHQLTTQCGKKVMIASSGGNLSKEDASSYVFCLEPVLGQGVELWGHRFVWTKEHVSRAELEPLRRIGDPLMDNMVHSSKEEIVAQLLKVEVPSWVDWERIEKGRLVFRRFFPFCGVSLFYASLVGGFSAALIVKTLTKAGGLSASDEKAVLRRVLRTTRFVCQVHRGSLRPGGDAWTAAIDVRHLHARVREKVKFDDEVAVNMEDSVVTLLAFSSNVLHGIEKLGGRVSDEDEENYLHLWRYVGFLLGIPDSLNPCVSLQRARAIEQSICLHILYPDKDSINLAHHLLKCVPGRFSHRAAWCRHLIGDKLADALELPLPNLIIRTRLNVELAILHLYAFCLRLPLIDSILLHFNDLIIDAFIRRKKM